MLSQMQTNLTLTVSWQNILQWLDMQVVWQQVFQMAKWVTQKQVTLTWALDVLYIKNLHVSLKQSLMEISSKMKLQLVQCIMQKITIKPFTYLDFYQMVVYTVITHIYMDFQKWLKNLVLQKFMYMHSQMVVTQLQLKISQLHLKTKSKKSAQVKSLQSQVVTMQWTVITDGTALSQHTMLS